MIFSHDDQVLKSIDVSVGDEGTMVVIIETNTRTLSVETAPEQARAVSAMFARAAARAEYSAQLNEAMTYYTGLPLVDREAVFRGIRKAEDRGA